ncbi:MAG: ribonuclease III [Defluviitaleaceae bacterium]|nr:ribonuclease III [Defluviitaleaceae bacterium]MCL2240348.1 ribonuclease III [Defluviitaleaceae bacterium]
MSELEAALGYTFRDANLLTQALTHSSYTYEHNLGTMASNERLEFLGDAVLELCVSHWLYTSFPAMPEGKLTTRRAALVCEPSLAALARGLNLGTHMRLGHGEAQSGGREKGSLLSDAFEAILGAIYLDGGLEPARNLVVRLFESHTDTAPPIRDNKTTLQEILQKNTGETASYQTIGQSGPPHNRLFTAQVLHQGKVLGQGQGTSKKEAEQQAASQALHAIQNF